MSFRFPCHSKHLSSVCTVLDIYVCATIIGPITLLLTVSLRWYHQPNNQCFGIGMEYSISFLYKIVSNISCRFLCKIKMQYLTIFLRVFIYKYTQKLEHFRILRLDRYCIPFFLLKAWYVLERFRVKQYFYTSRREINKMAKLY